MIMMFALRDDDDDDDFHLKDYNEMIHYTKKKFILRISM